MRLTVAGRQIEAAWWGGESTLIPLVLLHEGLGSVSTWRDFPDALAERTGRRVMAYSRFGHGHSDPPSAPHTVRFMHDEARLLPVVLDAAGVDRAHFVGHSDGGSIALIFAAAHADRVETLLLEAPHVFVEELSVASVQHRAAAFRETELRTRLARHHRHVDVAFSGWSDVWLDPEFRTWNLESLLPAISCPILLIQGEQDEYGTVGQLDAIEQQVRGPVERLVLPDCGHRPHRDQRGLVLSAMTTFLRSRA
ncbi:MAG TPA: alpha/beta hydrolase [Vicinamibacterales bacterium]|nr:alpha/beta hydrolase [Vicinamibacterales bacterium]